MNQLLVPTSYQTPLVRPKRGEHSGEAYSVALWQYELELARRLAYSNLTQRDRTVNVDSDDDDDVVVDVGGLGSAFVHRQSEVARRLDFDENSFYVSEDDDDDDNYTLERLEGDNYYESDEEGEEDEKPMNHKVEDMTQEKLGTSTGQDCPFCLEEFNWADCVTTNCNHSFCVTCYEKYTKRSCPCCRQYVDTLTTYCVLASEKIRHSL
jgi:hypothetical protein